MAIGEHIDAVRELALLLDLLLARVVVGGLDPSSTRPRSSWCPSEELLEAPTIPSDSPGCRGVIMFISRQSRNTPANCLLHMKRRHRSVSCRGTRCTGRTPLALSRLRSMRIVTSMVSWASATLCKSLANDHRASAPVPRTCSASKVSSKSVTLRICWRPAPPSCNRAISLFVMRISPVSSPSSRSRAGRTAGNSPWFGKSSGPSVVVLVVSVKVQTSRPQA